MKTVRRLSAAHALLAFGLFANSSAIGQLVIKIAGRASTPCTPDLSTGRASTPCAPNLSPSAADPTVPAPCATNISTSGNAGLRLISIDWCNLIPGRTYELQSSVDGKNWHRARRITWDVSATTNCWRAVAPLFPPAPFTAFQLFRLKDITP